MAALPCCPAARTTASPASGRAAVPPGDQVYPIGVCDEVLYVLGRMRVQQIIPAGEDRALLQETLAQHGPWLLTGKTRRLMLLSAWASASAIRDWQSSERQTGHGRDPAASRHSTCPRQISAFQRVV
jgi:hypothetical protein